MNRRIVPNYLKDRIEQAIARGWSDAFILTELDVEPAAVALVRAGMDEANDSPDVVPAATGSYGKGLS